MLMDIVNIRFGVGQKYESSGSAGEAPVLRDGARVEFLAAIGENSRVRVWLHHSAITTIRRGGIVKRNYLILGIATLAVAGALLAQDSPEKTAPKKTAGHRSARAAAARNGAVGKEYSHGPFRHKGEKEKRTRSI